MNLHGPAASKATARSGGSSAGLARAKEILRHFLASHDIIV